MRLMPAAERQAAIMLQLKAAEALQDERIRLPWKSGHKICPVVEVSLDAVVLNARSHRVRAQLESHSRRELVEKHPESEEAQSVLAEILRETDEYQDLLENLREEGQRDAGVVTRSGVLVNANTRAVALRDLGKRHIRVAVLPGGDTPEEVDEVELSLQVRKEFRQDYTFTNALLFIDELRNRYTAPEIARKLGYARSSATKDMQEGTRRVELATSVLALVREIQELSGGRIPLKFFDDAQQALSEIVEDYGKLRDTNLTAAERLRATRLIGILAKNGYRELRVVDQSFYANYLIPRLEEDPFLSDYLPTLISSQPKPNGQEAPTDSYDDLGLDILLGPQEVQLLELTGSDSAEDADPTPLMLLLARTESLETVPLPDLSGVGVIEVSRNQFVSAIHTAIRESAEAAKIDRRNDNRLELPSRLTAEATQKVERALEILREVIDSPEFSHSRFADRLHRLDRAVAQVRKVIEPGLATPDASA